MLAAAVEILLAAGDPVTARRLAEELGKLVAPSPQHIQAVAAYAIGTVVLAEGDAAPAIVELRRANGAWRRLRHAVRRRRASEAIARACRALADDDAATLELDAALAVFESLGARTDLARAGRLAGAIGSRPERSPRGSAMC